MYRHTETGPDEPGRARPAAMVPPTERSRNMTEESKLIYAYTRAQALADGVLVDVSEMAAQAGFKVPVALTHAAWEACVAVPRGVGHGQDARGRLWDVLMMCKYAARGEARDAAEVRFALSVFDGRASGLVSLRAVVGPDDDARPCVTIMTPGED